MRYTSFRHEGRARWGRVEGDIVHPLDHAHPTLIAAISEGALADIPEVDDQGRALSLTEVEFDPLIPQPGKILCVGLNYENHRKETGRDKVANPTIFTRFANSQIGQLQPMLRPHESTELDYEGELAVVIGKGGRRISREHAYEHVAGYSCYNDGSIRDWQRHTIQFTPGKNFAGTGAFGPWLVTPDEFGRPDAQRIRTRLNGQVMQDATFADMIFSVDRLIEYCSTFTRLEPGDIIVSGTPGGVGAKRDPQVFMKPGDSVEVDIEGIGVLQNTIADEMGP